MNLEERKAELKRDIDKYSKWLKDCEKEYEYIKDCIQPKTTELYNGIEKFFSVDKQNGNYEIYFRWRWENPTLERNTKRINSNYKNKQRHLLKYGAKKGNKRTCERNSQP